MLEKRNTTRPMEVVLIANEKGGVGKTTTALCLANCLTAFGYKVCVIDMDPSGNLTASALQEEPTSFLYDVFDNRCSLLDILVETPFGYIAPTAKEDPRAANAFFPAANDKSLTQIANRLIGLKSGEYLLHAYLREHPSYKLDDYFDFILLDSAPADHILITNEIVAADSVIVPVDMTAHAVNGLNMFLGSITKVRDHYKTNVQFDGMLNVKYSEEEKSERDVAATIRELQENFHVPSYKTKINYSATMKTALDNAKPILDYINVPNSHAVPDSLNMTLEFLQKRNLEPMVTFPGVQKDENGRLSYKRPSKADKEG